MPAFQKTYNKITFLCSQVLFTLLALYLTFLLLRYPAESLHYASTGLLLWFQKMIPTLLPFMILSGIMVRLHLTEQFSKWVHPLFHFLFGTSRNGSYVILMGMLCGFPMGARVIGELLSADKLSEQEASYLLAFTNNIGPIYFISFVMPTLSLGSHYLPFFIMYGVPLFYGFLLHKIMAFKNGFSPYKMSIAKNGVSVKSPVASKPMPLFAAIDDAVLSGLIGIAKLGGYMVFFNLLNIMLYPLSNLPEAFLAFCNCMLEITSGISRTGVRGLSMILILLPFGGFSCMAQTYSMIKDTKLSLRVYFCHKVIQTLLTALIYIVYAVFFSGVYSF